jgi:Rrf2 family protein
LTGLITKGKAVFNKETEYALRGLVYVQVQNYKGFKPGIAEIAAEIDAPPFYTGKIMQRLVKQGFLSSIKGKGGGFLFDAQKPELSLKIVIQAIEGTKTYAGCGFGLKHCDEEHPCPLHEQFAPIRNSINDLITLNTVQSLARDFHGIDNLILGSLKR